MTLPLHRHPGILRGRRARHVGVGFQQSNDGVLIFSARFLGPAMVEQKFGGFFDGRHLIGRAAAEIDRHRLGKPFCHDRDHGAVAAGRQAPSIPNHPGELHGEQ